MLEAESLFKEARGLRYVRQYTDTNKHIKILSVDQVTSKMKSSYYSSIKYENDSPVFGAFPPKTVNPPTTADITQKYGTIFAKTTPSSPFIST